MMQTSSFKKETHMLLMWPEVLQWGGGGNDLENKPYIKHK